MRADGKSDAEFERELRKLRERAVEDLDRVADERRRLRGLIAFIDGYGSGIGESPGPARARRRQMPRGDSLLEAVRQRPGVRASMLASLLERSFEQVNDELERLNEEGKAVREGMGWKLPGL